MLISVSPICVFLIIFSEKCAFLTDDRVERIARFGQALIGGRKRSWLKCRIIIITIVLKCVNFVLRYSYFFNEPADIVIYFKLFRYRFVRCI